MSKSKLASAGIEDIPCADLHNDPANVRKHGDQNLAAIKASLVRFGQQKPIVVNQDGVVVAGNGTLMAARALNWTTIKAIRTNLVGSEATAFAIADNRTAELAEWDESALHQQLAAIAIDDEELLAATGFDEKQLAKLADANSPEVIEEEIPEPPANPITQPGDLWLLGKHRLLCGDSTKTEDVERLMNKKQADMVFTDPPYGVNVQGKRKGSTQMIAGDLTQTAIPFSFDLAVTLATKDDARLYFCGGEGNLYLYQKLFEKFCHSLPRHLIWMKNGFTMKPNGYHNQYEIIFHGFKTGGGGLNKWYGARTEDAASDIWRISRDSSSTYEHPTQKPIALPARAISNSCPRDGLVYEPFGGAGSTFLASEQLGRICYGIEIDPKYCDVIVKRWETLTGQTATLEEV
jgi:DNA modification methylase